MEMGYAGDADGAKLETGGGGGKPDTNGSKIERGVS